MNVSDKAKLSFLAQAAIRVHTLSAPLTVADSPHTHRKRFLESTPTKQIYDHDPRTNDRPTEPPNDRYTRQPSVVLTSTSNSSPREKKGAKKDRNRIIEAGEREREKRELRALTTPAQSTDLQIRKYGPRYRLVLSSPHLRKGKQTMVCALRLRGMEWC